MNRRRGVSLLELLVVFAIIGVMMSLLLPAVFQAFEQANRTKCLNNWYQMRISGYIGVPPANNPENKPLPPYSIFIASLANVEQSAIYDMYNFERTFDSVENNTVKHFRPAVYNCPNANGDRTLTTYSYDLSYETKNINGKPTVVASFVGCEVSSTYAYVWTDPKGFEPSIIDAIKAKDGRRAFFGNHGDGHYLNAGLVKAFGGNPNGGGMEFNTDAGLTIRVWTKALRLDEQQ
jgi:prepilin-type N-terminal cleavage/methylation domain-containing protein